MKQLLALIPAVLIIASCEKEVNVHTPPSAVEPVVGYVFPEPEWSDADFTKWMSRAELQYIQDMSPAEKYFAFVEGRTNRGVAEFRAVTRELQSDQYTQWAVFWGIDEAELFDRELRLLRTGFERKSMQVFFDSTGSAIHQIVWLRPVGAIDNVPKETLADASIQITPEPRLPELVEIDSMEEEEEVVLLPQVADAPPVATIIIDEPAVPVAQKIYVVVSGDNLGKIAKQHKTTVSALKTKNDLKNDILRIGQKLKIP